MLDRRSHSTRKLLCPPVCVIHAREGRMKHQFWLPGIGSNAKYMHIANKSTTTVPINPHPPVPDHYGPSNLLPKPKETVHFVVLQMRQSSTSQTACCLFSAFIIELGNIMGLAESMQSHWKHCTKLTVIVGLTEWHTASHSRDWALDRSWLHVQKKGWRPTTDPFLVARVAILTTQYLFVYAI